MKGGGYGILVDIILGILGGVLGGWNLWAFGNLARWRLDRLHFCGICGRGDFGLDYPLTEKSLIVEASRACAHDRDEVVQWRYFANIGRPL